MARREHHPPNSEGDKRRPGGPDKHWIDKATAAFAFVAAIATALAAYFTGQQWTTALDTEKRQLRAYVGAAPGDLTNFGQDNQTISFVRKNYGQTPAYDVGFSVLGFSIVPIGQIVPINPNTMDCIFHQAMDPKASGLSTMFPGVEFPFRWILTGADQKSHAIFDAQLQSVKDGKAVFAYWGNICYRDTFERAHFTHYCWMYKGDHMTAKDADSCVNFNDSN